MSPAPLKLLAEDAEDLAVVSAALQDAVAKVGDIRFEAAGRRLTIALNRYRWEGEGGERVRTGLQIGGVTALRSRGLDRGRPAAVLSLLSVAFEPAAEPPGGAVVLTFSGAAELRAEVECVDAALADLTDAWPTPRRPKHEDDA